MDTLNTIDNLRQSINSVIKGKADVVDMVITALLAGGHILLEDSPGTGKTVLAKTLALSVNASFKRIQFTPDLLPSDITGTYIYNQNTAAFEFKRGPVFTNIVLADEINRATPRTQSSLLEAMDEKQVTAEGDTYKLSAPFFVIATQNPIEQQGTFPLPEAQLDRFLMKLSLGYPDFESETEIIKARQLKDPLNDTAAVTEISEILALQEEIKNVYVHDSIISYILNIAAATRENENIILGVSPRGSLALFRAAQSYSFINNMNFVTPQSVKKIAPFVFHHRIIPDPKLGLKNIKAFDLISEIINAVDLPVKFEK